MVVSISGANIHHSTNSSLIILRLSFLYSLRLYFSPLQIQQLHGVPVVLYACYFEPMRMLVPAAVIIPNTVSTSRKIHHTGLEHPHLLSLSPESVSFFVHHLFELKSVGRTKIL